MNADYRLLFCTCPDRDTALRVAETLVNEQLAACVSLLPDMTSIYRWQGEVQREPEILLLIKTTQERVEALAGRVGQLHPYEVPELIAVPITEGLPDYLNWITTCTQPQD